MSTVAVITSRELAHVIQTLLNSTFNSKTAVYTGKHQFSYFYSKKEKLNIFHRKLSFFAKGLIMIKKV